MANTSEWLKTLPLTLFKKDTIPQLGYPPSFDWKVFENALKEAFKVDSLTLSPSHWEWKNKQGLADGIGTPIHSFTLTVPPIAGPAWIVLSKQDLETLFSLLLSDQESPLPLEIDRDYFLGFCRFLAIEALQAASLAFPDRSISFQLSQDLPLPETEGCALDLSFTLKGHSFFCRLILSEAFVHSWKIKYSVRSAKTLNESLAEKIDVSLHVEIGHVTLSQEEVSSLAPGDFVILDAASIKPGSNQGRAKITVEGIGLFNGTIAQNKVTLEPL